ncbi:hypothetical protein P9209_04530 [Prescottella defluvii]|nr:hypothetical protein P9209_04530 [Prescottella defluvii]
MNAEHDAALLRAGVHDDGERGGVRRVTDPGLLEALPAGRVLDRLARLEMAAG